MASGNNNRLRNPSSLCSREDLAWLAGFYEGEGCITRNRTPGLHSYWMLMFSQKNLEPLAKVHALCGGTVIAGDSRGHRGISELRIYGERARAVAHAMAPLLSKRRQNQLAPLLERGPRKPVTPSYYKRPIKTHWIQVCDG